MSEQEKTADELLDLMRDPGKDGLTAQKCFDALDARCKAGDLPREWRKHPIAPGAYERKRVLWEAEIERLRKIDMAARDLVDECHDLTDDSMPVAWPALREALNPKEDTSDE
jgi:hypothetical protein